MNQCPLGKIMKYLILACLLALAGLIGCQPSVPSTITGD